jgi:hypothetical protein
MHIKKNIAISESGFVFNPSTGDSFSTNPIGLEIIKLLKEGKTRDEIKTGILKTYATEESAFEKDFYDFLIMLQTIKILEADEEKKN